MNSVDQDYPSELYPLGVSAGVVEVELSRPPFSSRFLIPPLAIPATVPKDFTRLLKISFLTRPLGGGKRRSGLSLEIDTGVSICRRWV